MVVSPVTLTGRHVRLVPLSPSHAPDLAQAVCEDALWQVWYTTVPRPEHMAAEIARRLALAAAGSMLPFAVIDPADGAAVGMTTFMDIDAIHRRVEIGATWYAARMRRTALNTEAKLLLLSHAFDTLDCIAVELRTHILNQTSRRAIERIGAKLDGILRNHKRTSDGNLRDTCVYSIVAGEWPTIRTHLTALLARPPAAR